MITLCCDIYGGHMCKQSLHHNGQHTCGEPSDGNPCHTTWTTEGHKPGRHLGDPG